MTHQPWVGFFAFTAALQVVMRGCVNASTRFLLFNLCVVIFARCCELENTFLLIVCCDSSARALVIDGHGRG